MQFDAVTDKQSLGFYEILDSKKVMYEIGRT